MLTRAGDRLAVIEDFRIDFDLPKHNKQKQDVFDTDSDEEEDGVRSRMPVQRIIMSANPRFAGGVEFGVQQLAVSPPIPWYKRLFSTQKKEPDEIGPQMSIQEFFASVKNSAQELITVNERAVGYEKALRNAKQMGQDALFEKLSSGLNAFKMETQLIAMGLTKYVEEQDIVAFYKQSKKGLRLDYVKNFTRTVPESIMLKKTHADELFIFDSYVVLHYDPDAKAFAETEKEKEARKDPILFGLMKDITKLYFIGDWIDEHCDLTLDQLAETMGRSVVQSISEGHPHRDAQ